MACTKQYANGSASLGGESNMASGIQSALVTGGAGFIGSHLVEALAAQGCQVTVLDNLSSGRLSNLETVRDKIRFVEGDIRDEGILGAAIDGCDLVFHHAAVVSVTQTVEAPVDSADVNELGTLKVLDAARRHQVQRLVLASSSAVYGDPPQLPKIESMAPRPLSPYAVQKYTNELYAAIYFRLYGLQTVCLRYFNVYGPRQDPSSPYSGVISIFITRALENEAPLIYGDGRQTRDFVFVSDVVQANLLAATQADAAGQVFNIGTSDSVDINSLWELTAKLAHCSRAARYVDSRPGDIMHSLSSIQKACRVLGFQPRVSLNSGLDQTIAWYREQN